MLIVSHICWNLFLALVPVALGLAIGWLNWRDKPILERWYVWLPLVLLWLGFLPNTCYLLTEWRHFIEIIIQHPDQTRQAAHDKMALTQFLALTAFYIVYSGLGLLTFSMAIWPVAHWLRPSRAAKFWFFLVCALGVYLGLIRRLNTWDVVRDPKTVVSAIAVALSHPFTVALIVGFALVIWLNYWVFEVFIDGFLVRLRRLRREAKAAG